MFKSFVFIVFAGHSVTCHVVILWLSCDDNELSRDSITTKYLRVGFSVLCCQGKTEDGVFKLSSRFTERGYARYCYTRLVSVSPLFLLSCVVIWYRSDAAGANKLVVSNMLCDGVIFNSVFPGEFCWACVFRKWSSRCCVSLLTVSHALAEWMNVYFQAYHSWEC